MARYIKANPLVAKYLNLENDRNTVKDGNYILWQNDMLAFGPLTQLGATLAAIGAIALMPHEAREEQDGTNCRALPIATDERFIVAPAVVEEAEQADNTNEAPTEDEGEEPTTDASGDDADTEADPDEETETDNPDKDTEK